MKIALICISGKPVFTEISRELLCFIENPLKLPFLSYVRNKLIDYDTHIDLTLSSSPDQCADW